MGMGSQNDTESIPDLAAGVEVRDGMVRASPSDGVPSFSRWREYPRRDDATPRVTLSSHSGRLTRSPPLEFLLPAAILLPRRRPTTQVSKHDFDMAVKNAQEALRAKTSSSQAMLQQASSSGDR